VRDPAHDASVNVLGGLALLESCRRAGVRRIVYSSTGGAAYGDTDVVPTPEEHAARPCSPYGISKVAVEQYLDAWQQLHGISTISLRYANVYGPRQDPHGEAGVVAIFCGQIVAGAPPTINGDGDQTRDYVYVEDVAAANLRALERPEVTGPVNIATGTETTVNELWAALAAGAGVATPARHGPARPGEQRRSCLAIDRARRLLDWRPTVSLADGLARTLDYFRHDGGVPSPAPKERTR
jgi:UDP-glucose 4-epimerase